MQNLEVAHASATNSTKESGAMCGELGIAPLPTAQPPLCSACSGPIVLMVGLTENLRLYSIVTCETKASVKRREHLLCLHQIWAATDFLYVPLTMGRTNVTVRVSLIWNLMGMKV